MDMNKAVLAALGALCLGVGAGGAWLATRPDAPPQALEATETVTTDGSVEQSEALVGESAEPVEPAAPVAPPAATQRQTPRPAPRPAAPREAPRPIESAPRPEPQVLSPPRLEAVRPEPTLAPVVETPAPPPAPTFEDFVIAADSVLGLQIETSLSSERARLEDEVVARVARDVRVGDRVVIPAGSRAEGEVTLVERGGRLKERARLGVRFTSVVLADGTRVPIETETIYREGDPPSGESAAKIGGGAIGGAIIGGILGGAKGAIIGGSAGAGAGTAAVMAGGRNAATLPSGTPVTVRITEPATVTVEK